VLAASQVPQERGLGIAKDVEENEAAAATTEREMGDRPDHSRVVFPKLQTASRALVSAIA